MVGVVFLAIVLIGLYFAYLEGMHRWNKYLADRLAVLKDAETAVIKTITDNAAKGVAPTAAKMTDTEFQMYLDRVFIPWARTKGLIR